MIQNLTIGDLMIDCANPERIRDFYADLMGWEKLTTYGPALRTGIGMVICFTGLDIPYAPPVWPEAGSAQQKQMHLDLGVVDFPAAVERAIGMGARKADAQYGDGSYFVTMIDPDGHPFCLCKSSENKAEKNQFDLYFEEKGYGAIPNISLNIDCQIQKTLRAFYAQLTGWDQEFDRSALITGDGMIVCFQGCDNDATMDEYIPPVWPEEPGKQQKQMHLNFQVDDLQAAVAEAIRIGARKAAAQYGGGHFVTLIDTEGHPFCLCARK